MPGFEVNPNGSQQVEYTMADMPVRTGENRLSAFSDFTATCHWHNDFEMLVAVQGEIDYFVNGDRLHLACGEGIIVNARRLHFAYSARHRDCRYRFVVFHPGIFGAYPSIRQALRALMSDESADCRRVAASSEAILHFNELWSAAAANDGLRVTARCADLLSAFAADARRADADAKREDWALLRRMTGYIQANYAGKITLAGIASAGAVCRNRCCALFREKLRMTPIEYVTRYRLDKACSMLRGGSSVTEAALSCGFQGASYFAEVFKRAHGITPTAFRRQYETTE